jgi:hypothetical protein
MCRDGRPRSADVLGSSKKNRKLLDVAGYIIEWHYYFSHAGYPADVWQPQLEEIEKALLARAESESEHQLWNEARTRARPLVTVAEQYRHQSGKKLPKMLYSSSCGAGGPVGVFLKSSPPGGAISIISQFEYELCALDHDSSDMMSCNAWRRVKSDGKESISGIYYISVKWPDKTMPPTRYDLQDVEPNMTYHIP